MNYDVVILGGGSAGIVAGVTLGGLGMKVLLIEKGKLGGECLNTGCVPSKALLHAAKVAHTMRRADAFGLKAAPVSRDDAAGVMRQVRRAIHTVETADASGDFLKQQGVEIRYGDARFITPDALQLGDETLTADHYLLCTGSRPRVPDIPGMDLVERLTNETLFSLDAIPESLLVLGGGPVGVEMAQAFARLGSKVTLVQKGERILPKDDSELVETLQEVLRADGVDLRLNGDVCRFEACGDAVVAVVQPEEGEEAAIPCRAVLFAVGRLPNTEGLNLEAAGVRCADDGVEVDETLHTTGPRVWACGDVLGRYQFSHMAEYEAKKVAQNIFAPVSVKAKFRVAPWCTFTDPELASVGLTEEKAKRLGVPHMVLRQPFSQDDRALVEGEGQGCVKILVAPGLGGQILGASILGPRAGELIQEFILAMEQNLSIRALADSIHVYPALTMACQHAAQRWYEQLVEDPKVKAALKAYRRARPALPALATGAAAALVAAGLYGLTRLWRDGDDPDHEADSSGD